MTDPSQVALEMRDAEMANARLDTHEAVCGERYKAVERALNDLKAMMLSQGTDFHFRLNTMSSRIWGAAMATLGAVTVGMASLIFFLLTRGAK